MEISNRETLLILGAGASKDCGAPLIGDFLPIAFSKEVMDKLGEEERKRFNNVKKFWKKINFILSWWKN